MMAHLFDFNYSNPTQIVFGTHSFAKLGELIPPEAIGHKPEVAHFHMRNNIQRTGVKFVFRLEARIPGMAGYVGLEVAHLHGGGHILLHLAVIAGIAHIGREAGKLLYTQPP